MNARPGNRSLVRLHVAAVLAASLAGATRAVAGGALPVPCVPGTCGPTSPSFVTFGKATASESGNNLKITQSTPLATLNWSSFNISTGNSVQFLQPASSSIALNRIYQQSPSSIFGQLSANGQIYLVNPNGFLFGPTSQVNAAGIIASSLGISDQTFQNGILTPIQNAQAALQSDGRTSQLDNVGNPILGPDGQPLPVQVVVQQGAQLSSPGGRILLAGQNVTNAGTLSAPDGQVVLAAGQAVYLQASTDPALRGLVVEVDKGGTAWNQLTGQISADRGNVTLVGLAVNQDGRISATTSVSANGSVRLEAADTAGFNGNSVGDNSFSATSLHTLGATQGGTLELGPGSSIDIEPEYSSSAAAPTDPTQPQLRSAVTLVGEQVFLDGGSITAHNGVLDVVAAANPSAGGGTAVVTDGNPAAQIRVHSGTSIDLSGSVAELPMSANILPLQLRSNELADDPTQRGGPLQGQTVYVDMRAGTSIVGPTALQQAEQAVPYNVAYRTTAGGSASFESEGDVVVEQGATINVSGGRTVYDGGVVQTTQLVGANGQLYDIGTANPLLAYTGVVNPTFTQTYNKWGVQTIAPTPGLSHYESGYVQGASAGSITVAAPAIVLDGTLEGQAVNGPLQRSGSSVASGGTLILGLQAGLPTNGSAQFLDYLTPTIEFTNQPPQFAALDGAPVLPLPLQLPVAYLGSGGFQKTVIYGDSSVTVPAGVPLNLIPGSSLVVEAPRIDVLSDITALGGSVQLQSNLSYLYNNNPQPLPFRAGIEIGSDVTLDVRGQWTNDSPVLGSVSSYAPTLQNGGTIALSLGDAVGGELIVGDGVALRASGGAWLSSSDTLKGGSGGSISILASPLGSSLQLGSGIELDAFGADGAPGGSFALSGPRIAITSAAPSAAWSGPQRVDDLSAPGGVLTFDTSLFSNYGFSSVALTATAAVAPGATSGDVLTVGSGASIAAAAQTQELSPGYMLEPGGGTISRFSQLLTLPPAQQTPSSVSLNVLPQAVGTIPARLDVEGDSSITTGPGGSISLVGIGGVYVDGMLRAPGGRITLQAPSPGSLDPVYANADPGFVPAIDVELGPQGVLDVSGALVSTPNNLGLPLGNVLNGGTVNLLGDRGAVLTDPGSIIDIAGTQAPLDVPTALGSATYAPYQIGSSAGTLAVRSGVSISLRGTLDAEGGGGNYGDPAGGTLQVELTRQNSSWFSVDPAAPSPYPGSPFTIQLVDCTRGLGASAQTSGLAVLGVPDLEAAGVDNLQLLSQNNIQFSASTPLNLARGAVFDSPVLEVDNGAHATVNASYVQLANSLQPSAAAGSLPTGTGVLSFNAGEIDLLGNPGVSGAQQVTLTSAGDVLLRGTVIGGNATGPQGSFTLDGNLTIDAARIYPATSTAFTVQTLSNGETVRLGQTAPSPGTPLSAGGSIAILAGNIVSSGTLLAPFGTIDLAATTSVDLESGSLTSVSAAGTTIPFGQTQLGAAQWVNTANGAAVIPGIPQRSVLLNAPALTIAKGATVDLQGGGDLQAYEWIPGTGGTVNSISPGAIPGLYAILPSLRGQSAPFDPGEMAGTTLQPAETIYLSGGDGLAAGFYPLLPARYALLPGAYLVQVQSGFSNIAPGQQEALTDGTPVVAGYVSFGSTGLHAGGYQGVAIWPGSYSQQLAQYQLSNASSFFAAAAAGVGLPPPNLPADAGQLSIAVDESLNVAGTVLGNSPGSSGKSSVIDVSATNIEITANPTDPVPSGTVGLAASVIDSWQPGELVIGGHPGPNTITTLASGAQIEQGNIGVAANSVTLGAGAQLAADQVILVANSSIDLQPGAVLQSTSVATGKAPSTAPAVTPVFLTSGTSGTGTADPGAALLAVSDVELPIVHRAGTTASLGTIAVEAGASVGSRGAIAIDAPGNVSLAGTVSGPGASWSLASSSIGFVGSGTSSDSLQISSGLQASLAEAGNLELSSLGAINFYVPVTLGTQSASGTPVLSSLTLAAQALDNFASGGTSTFTAQTLTVSGPLQALTVGASASGSAVPPPATPGVLQFNAGEFDTGTGLVTIAGVAQTRVDATSLFAAQGAAGSVNGLATSGDLVINAPLVTAANGASAQLSAPSGALTIGGSGAAAPPAGYLGGELDFSAASISQSGAVIVPGGIVSLKASGDIDLAGSAVIDTAGPQVAIADQTVGVQGGNIALVAGGNLNLTAGSRLNVSGAGSASAGEIALTAAGTADVGATLSGHAGGGGAQGGQFSLDAGSLSQSLTALADGLLNGGFNDAVSIRAHTGDLVLSPGHELLANSVSLTADGGAVDIGGTVSAPSSSLRGAIQLFGGGGVTIAPGAAIIADTAGGSGIGGNIELGAGALGTVTIDAGSTVSALGSSADGALIVRAPLVGGNAIAANLGGGGAANLSQLSQIIVEPVITEAADQATPGVVTAADWSRIESDVTTLMGNVLAPITSQISGELSSATQPALLIRPAVDVVGTGPLTLAAAPDFNSWRFNNQPVDLTIRAAGPLTVATTLSDGFATATIHGRANHLTTITVLETGPGGSVYDSADVRLVAGSDTASPDPLATVSVGNPLAAGTAPASLTVNAGTAVRTGTGEIDLVAAGDIVFGAGGTGTAGAEVYTGGMPGAPYQTFFLSSSVFNFPTSGGNLEVSAGGSITGAPIPRSQNPQTPNAGPSPTSWIISEGGPAAHTTEWGVDLTAYQSYGWNLASLGGGDVSVRSGANIDNLSAAAGDSYFTNPAGSAVQQLSGGLVVTAAGNIGTGEFYIADGSSVLAAGGALTTAARPGDSGAGSLIALGNAQVSVDARLGALIDAVANPTSLTQVASAPGLSTGFFTYGGASALNVQSTAGDVVLEGNQSAHAATLLGGVAADFTNIGGQIYPATVSATAVSGNLTLGSATLFPSAEGQLRLLAGQDIDYAGSTGFLSMSDAFAANVPTPQNPSGALTNVALTPFASGAHVNDPDPAVVGAGRDINNLTLSVPKATDIVGGRDIVNLSFSGQNLNPADLTIISAGRDIIDPISLGNTSELITVGGPGRVDLIAGRNFDLGLSQGLQTTGNLDNANLPTAAGASLTVMAGLGAVPDYGAFLSKIVATDPANQAQLVSYVEGVTGQSNLSFAQAEQAFEAMSSELQRPLFNRIFFEELAASGVQDNTVPGAGFALGYGAIDALFPNSRTAAATGSSPYAGGVSLSFSKIYTDSGGSISILAPGGSLNVGLATVPAALQGAVNRGASELGIVAEGAGDVDIYTRGDVNVNASRVFTLGGGNILIWSDEGNIDAGKGAKTSVSAPPPQISVSANGTITETFFGAVAGSGIRTIQALPGVPPGNVNLIAPEGTVNAGDAGIGASGNINIAAQHVIGLDNIQFGGTATGVPAQVSDIGVSLSGAASLASSATNSAASSSEEEARKNAAAAPQAQAAVSWLDVFVIGLGEENCGPQDLECLKRQKKE